MEAATLSAETNGLQAESRDLVQKQRRLDSPVATPPATPTPAAAIAHDLCCEIRNIYQHLALLKSLAPCDSVNVLLSRLVTLCIEPYSSETVDYFSRIDGVDMLCQNLQALCATAEGELERHWARVILDGANTAPTPDPTLAKPLLKTFPYYTNYLSLSALEASLLAPFLSTPPRTIAFIGSGPLPLSSICLLSHFPTATIHNIDRSTSALSLSSVLAANLGFAARMTFACEDATHIEGSTTDWAHIDVVFLAALVGMRSSEKISVLRRLAPKLHAGTLVVCRSARGTRRVLYPVLELTEELQSAGFEVLAEMHPWSEVVNSVVVLRVKARG